MRPRAAADPSVGVAHDAVRGQRSRVAGRRRVGNGILQLRQVHPLELRLGIRQADKPKRRHTGN